MPTTAHRPTPCRSASSPVLGLIALAGMMACLLPAGCAQRSPRTDPTTGTSVPPIDTGLATLLSNRPAVIAPPPDPTKPPSDAEKAAWANQSALQLEQLMASGAIDAQGRPIAQPAPGDAPSPPTPTPTATPTPTPTAPPTASTASDAGLEPASTPPDSALETLTQAAPAGDGAAPASPPAPTSAEVTITDGPASTGNPLVDLARNMARLLAQTDGAGNRMLADAAALAPIESMRPGVLSQLDAAPDQGDLGTTLTSQEVQTLRDARQRVLSLPAGGVDESLLRSLRGVPVAGGALRLPRALLATRVDGFGRYTPFVGTTFAAGRALRAIVYVEVDGFSPRPAREGDRLQLNVPLDEQRTVELTQEVSLFHDADGLLAWHRPAQVVSETTRSVRRDFYLIQIIDLPATLSIGRYNLQVTVVDRTTNAQAQATIPIEIVADPSAVRTGW